MSGDYDTAHEAIASMFELIKNTEEEKPSEKYQISELHFFAAHMHHKVGDLKKAIKLLEKKSKQILDHVRLNKTLTQFYMENNQAAKALACLEKLLEINPHET